MTGADRAAFLNRFCTNKVTGIAAGEGREAFLTNAKGRILAHPFIFVGADSLTLRTDAGQAQRIIEHLDFYRIHDDVAFADQSEARFELLLAGRRCEEALGLPDLPGEHLGHVEANLSGTPVSIRRVAGLRAPAFLLSCPVDAVVHLWRSLLEAGATACAREAFEPFRIESGWPRYGTDITEANLPQEVARDQLAISFDKGCYLGQETIARIDSRGHVNRTLVGLRLESNEIPPLGAELTAHGKAVGHVTSAAFSPGFGTTVALAYVRTPHNHPGTQLDSPHGRATAVSLPTGPES
jgi:folate-binding protein YgfZ